MASWIKSGERHYSLVEHNHRAARAASGFAALGVAENDSIATFLRNDFPLLETMAAAGLLGAYLVPVNWHFKGDEAGYVVADSNAKVVVTHADLWPMLHGHVPPGIHVLVVETPAEIRAAYGIDPAAAAVPPGLLNWEAWLDDHAVWTDSPSDSPGSMIYTSGTTGQPKGVRRSPATPAELEQVYQRVAEVFGIRPGMTAAMTGPLYHSAPNAYGRFVVLAGGNLVLMPRFDAEGLLKLIEKERITHLHMVPTMFVRLLRLPADIRRKYDLSSLEFVIHGAAPCPPAVKRQMIDWWGPVIHEYYGSTEAGLVTAVNSTDWLARPGTVGQALDGTEIRIFDADGNILTKGETGEIYVSLQSISQFTYHNQDAKRREIERNGMITNGDIGYFDSDGFLYLCDRKIDMVISGGVNIYPAEIEAALLQMDGVRDCAVFGIPDADFGESLAAAVEPDGTVEISGSDVQSFLRDRIADYKVPRLVTFHDAMPREDSGKLYKRKLREPYWRDAGRQI